MQPLKIFIGYDSRYPIAYHVCAHSILSRASVPVSITPLVQDSLRKVGLYWREKNPLESTEFSFTRFLVPYLSGFDGWSIFMDSDMLCLADIADISLPHDASVSCCQHDYTPTNDTKFLGAKQTAYPRKNWSSVMVFSNALCRELTPEYVNSATGLELHRFQWNGQRQIGNLPLEWNWLVGEYASSPAAKMLHFTNGGPFNGVMDCPYADTWIAERDAMMKVA